jgi:NlpE N-terminal domain
MGMSLRCVFFSLFLVAIVFADSIQSPLIGTYGAILPAADAAGRVITLQLLPNGDATLTTQFIGGADSVIEIGKWTAQSTSATVVLREANRKKESNQITWTLEGDTIKATKYDTALYGSSGLSLQRSSTGQLVKTEFEGVNIQTDSWLAKSTQGSSIAATPVEDAPELGGGAPKHIRFTFNNAKQPEDINPEQPQILIFSVKELKELHPSVSEEVGELQQLMEDKPDSPNGPIPVFPIFSAQQVFQCHVRYLFFENGGGVRFVTYYQQDAAPIKSDHMFYTFQGLTSDGHWYISAFWPVTTSAIPKGNQQMNAAQSDAFAKSFDSYLSNLLGTLEGTPSAGFSPDLKVLDEMIESLNVKPKM